MSSDDLVGDRLTGEDHIDGRTATGVVGSGRDIYHFSGEVDSLTINGDARALLNGVMINGA